MSTSKIVHQIKMHTKQNYIINLHGLTPTIDKP